MAASNGHLLVPKTMRLVKFAISKTASLVRSTVTQSSEKVFARGANASLQPIRVYAHNQPIHPVAYLKQSRSQSNRWFSTTLRNLSKPKSTYTPPYDRSKFPVSQISKAISQRGAAPFASTLRPNITGGALRRSAGGYSLGGASRGARHFSHTSGCQAQVVQNVSAGIRAFVVGGGKARFDGIDPITGEKRFRPVSSTENAIHQKFQAPISMPKGSTLEFALGPTITALSPSSNDSTTLNNATLLHSLSTDFARSLRTLSLILSDLGKLANFGDLPISLASTPTGPVLRIRFPGSNADLVTRLCEEVGVSRGVVREDDAWKYSKEAEMALLMPFAPTARLSLSSEPGGGGYFAKATPRPERDGVDWRNMLSPLAHNPSEPAEEMSFEEATLRSPSGYASLRASDFAEDDPYYPTAARPSRDSKASEEYEGLEGIYKFLQVCEDSRRQL